jgi:hypothetical protein
MNWIWAFSAFGIVSAIGVISSATTAPSDPPKPAAAKKAAAKFTYANGVGALLNEKCVSCHRPGEVAPFSLMGYENAKKWAPMVAAVTHSKRMPPWKAVAGYGQFEDENRLSAEQIGMLKSWFESGAPRGDKKLEPKTPTFPATEWSLGQPDILLAPTKPYRLEADGADVYRNFVVKNTGDKPIYVRGTDVKPGNRKVVHHVIVYLDGLNQAQRMLDRVTDGQEGYEAPGGGVGIVPTGSLGGWAPGVAGRFLPEGTAFVVPPKSNFIIQVHYHKTGKPETDLTRVGLYTTETPPTREMNLNWIFNFMVNIPAGEKQHKLRQTFTYRNDVTIYGAMPHMHLVGKDMKSWFELPDGTKKPLVFVDDWDFNWQLVYRLKEPMAIPAGTKQIVEATYDNSADNPRNPNNPPKRVTWGEETTDEMFLLITYYTFKNASTPRPRSIIGQLQR